MTERELYKPLIVGAKQDGWHLTRISDNPGHVKRPFDLFGFTRKRNPLAIEVKLVAELSPYEKFPWDLFGLHQIKYLEFYAKSGCLGLIAIYEGKSRKMNVFTPGVEQYGNKNLSCSNIRRTVLNPVKSADKQAYTGWNSIE